MGKFWTWLSTSLFLVLGIMLSYFYLFTSAPDEDALFSLKGTIRGAIKRDDDKIIYLREYKNPFSESYLSRKEFDKIRFTRESVFIHIRKVDTVRLNKNRSIKLWSLKLNNETFYTAEQEIQRQSFAHKYYLPILIIVCFILAPVIYRYQKNYYRRRSTKDLS